MTEPDAYRGLRDHLLLSGNNSQHSSLLVASTLQEQSAAACALKLAKSFADAGRRTLLVDAHFEHPQFQRLLRDPNVKGFTDLLAGEEADYQLLPDGNRNLCLLPAGLRTSKGGDEIASSAFDTLFQRWVTEFDALILHGPPILDSSASLILAGHTHRVLLVEREVQSSLHALRRAKEMLSQAGASISEVVLTTAEQPLGA